MIILRRKQTNLLCAILNAVTKTILLPHKFRQKNLMSSILIKKTFMNHQFTKLRGGLGWQSSKLKWITLNVHTYKHNDIKRFWLQKYFKTRKQVNASLRTSLKREKFLIKRYLKQCDQRFINIYLSEVLLYTNCFLWKIYLLCI